MSINLTYAWLNSFFTSTWPTPCTRSSVQVSWKFSLYPVPLSKLSTTHAQLSGPVVAMLKRTSAASRERTQSSSPLNKMRMFHSNCRIFQMVWIFHFKFSWQIKVSVVYKNASSFRRDMISLFLMIYRLGRHAHANTEPHKLPREVLNSCCWAYRQLLLTGICTLFRR